MGNVAVLGGPEFVLGFQLAGIKDTIESSEDSLNDVENIIQRDDINIVIIDEKILEKMDEHNRVRIEDSVKPVFIPLSTEATQEGLRRLIRKSIGIDLWKEG